MDSWISAKEVRELLPDGFVSHLQPASSSLSPSRHPALIPTLALGAVCIAVAAVLLRSSSSARLLNDALHSQDPSAQLKATQGLLKLGSDALDETKAVVSQSENHDVTSLAIAGLANHRDYSSIDLLFAKLDDPTPFVRASAARALARLLGRDHHFPVEGSADERVKSKETIIADWNALKNTELFRRNIDRLHVNTEDRQ